MDASSWYAVDEVAPGVLRIVERHARPLMSCNVWLLRGRDADLLVDTGVGAVPLLPRILAITGREPVCLLTHSHYDHVGAAHEFRQRLAHRAEADILARGGRGPTLAEGWLGPDSFDRWPDDVAPPAAWEIAPAPATRLVADGDTVDLGDRILRIVHLPGHSPGLVGVLDGEAGRLATSDALYDGRMVSGLPGSDPRDFGASLARIVALAPRLVLPGHGEPFDGGTAAALASARLSRSSPT